MIVQLSPFIDDHGFFYLKHVHDTNRHCGLEFNRVLIQQQFLVHKGRKVLRRIIRHCIACRRKQQDVIQLKTTDLSKERLPSTINFQFRTNGIDYLGPFFIKSPRAEKRYILHFTCIVTRAVHIEVTAKLNTVHLPKRPASVHQIRQRNYICVCQQRPESRLGRLTRLASQDISASLGLQHNACYFDLPAASHFEGAWERLIVFFQRHLLQNSWIKNPSRTEATRLCL